MSRAGHLKLLFAELYLGLVSRLVIIPIPRTCDTRPGAVLFSSRPGTRHVRSRGMVVE